MKTSSLLREVVREYTRSQRRTADCGDTASTVQCHILAELVRTDHITQQELADRLMLDKGWVSRGIDGLAADGLVVRMPHPVDRRRMLLRLTPAGQARAAALEARLEAHAGSLVGDLAPGHDAQLAALLAQVLANLRANRCDAACTAAREEVAYRRAGSADWPQIEALLREARLPVEDAADHLRHFTVGTGEAGLVAAGGFEAHGAAALLRSFVVAPSARGRAHGADLLRYVLRDARAAGIDTVYLLTQTAERFFARHGFQSVERGAAPQAIRATREFTGLCPASARLMVRSLSNLETASC
jgi:amino-acid N-acetyltransferase